MSGKRARRERQRAQLDALLADGTITFTCGDCSQEVRWDELTVDQTDTTGPAAGDRVPVTTTFGFRCQACARARAGYQAN